MIGCLQGVVVKIGADFLLLSVSGVGYKIFCAKTTLDTVMLGENRFFYIETAVGEDYIKLYGFETQAAQNWFLTLSSVQGVGAKAAFAILSVCSLSDISNAILFGERHTITKAQGVGPKLAERIVNELKNKKELPPIYDADDVIIFQSSHEKMSMSVSTTIDSGNVTGDDTDKSADKVTDKSAIQTANQKRILIDNTVSALMNLGYGRSDALKAVLDIYESCDSNGDAVTENILIRTALQHIGKMKESL
jgi:holliday junction DNA helicase RuvA